MRQEYHDTTVASTTFCRPVDSHRASFAETLRYDVHVPGEAGAQPLDGRHELASYRLRTSQAKSHVVSLPASGVGMAHKTNRADGLRGVPARDDVPGKAIDHRGMKRHQTSLIMEKAIEHEEWLHANGGRWEDQRLALAEPSRGRARRRGWGEPQRIIISGLARFRPFVCRWAIPLG